MDFQPLQHLMRAFANGGHAFHNIPGGVNLYGEEFGALGHRLDIRHDDPFSEDHNNPRHARVHSYLSVLSNEHEDIDDVDFADHGLVPNILRASTIASKNHKNEWETHPSTGSILVPIRTALRDKHGKVKVKDLYLPHDLGEQLDHYLTNAEPRQPRSLGDTMRDVPNHEIGVNYAFAPEIEEEADRDPAKFVHENPAIRAPFDVHGALWNELAGSPHIPRMSWHGLPEHVIVNQDHFMGGNMAYNTIDESLRNIG